MTREDSAISDDGAGEGAPVPRRYPGGWPPLRGDYRLGNPGARIAVVTLSSHIAVEGSAIWGPCKTENLGVEKVVANIISNSDIRFLLICGDESKGHLPGDSIIALHKNGVDADGRIIGSRGAIPFIENLPKEAIERFQRQVTLIDRIGLVDEGEIQEVVVKYRNLSEPFPEPPMEVIRKRARWLREGPSSGDASFGEGVFLDASSWVVAEAMDGPAPS
ncbi:MAG: Putative methyltransferase Mtx subunit A [Methanothrix sp.]|jgi:tetrahydromethanopterin S-methyltransferase subunit A|nr:MAG: Putative methyltransferase Mtx subunit A [Methanothrix sp.]